MAQGSSYYFVGQSLSTQGPTFVNPSFTGQMLGADGTAAAPAYSFTSDPNIGMYRVAEDVLGFSTGGVLGFALTGGTGTFTGGLTVGASSTIAYNGSTQLLASTNGTLQVTTLAGAFGTLLLGANGAGTGIRLVSSANTLTLQNGNGVATGTFATPGLTVSGTTVVNSTGSNNVGLYVGPNASGIGITHFTAMPNQTKLVTDITTGTVPGFLLQGQYVETRTTSPRNLAFIDIGTSFDNTGASAQIVYNLPTAVKGYKYRFRNSDAGAAFTKIQCPGTDRIALSGTLGGSPSSLTSTAVWTTIDLECIKTGTWVVVALTGTWTLA